MKIFSSKKWESMAQQMVDLQMDLNESREDNQTYLKQVTYLSQLKTKISVELMQKKLELKNLKTYCTKHDFDYSKLYKKESK